jgi:His/Glu/Gln/Arg/opine family amino acid ABC transporter permease subunit
MNLDFSQIVPYIPFILEGIWVTLKFVIISIILGFILGTILALCKISRIKALNWFGDAYTSIFRGTPLILQLMLIYFAIPQLTGYDISPFLSSILAFGLNSSAYVSEIIRAGIQAVDKGQTEAAQALKNILPALMNEFITLTKESAIVSTIGYLDLMRRAQVVGADTYRNFEPLIFVGLIYWILVMVLTLAGKRFERRLKYSD